MKLRTEAPVNGGRNYNGPKVNDSLALVKSGYMLEGLSIPRYLKLSDNALGADNQQERPVGEDPCWNPQRLYARFQRSFFGEMVGKDIVRTAWRHAESGRNVHSSSHEKLSLSG